MRESCKDCKWWTSHGAGRFGLCHGGLPVVIIAEGEFGTYWPETEQCDFCAHFTQRERLQQEAPHA